MAAPAMGTATSRRGLLGLAFAAILLAGCGGSTQFAWLRPAQPPSGWPVARIASGASMPYPPSWTRIAGDSGTATVALLDSRHDYLGYLNITPRQGDETLADWSRFRTAHNKEEGDRDVTSLAAATGSRVRGGSASCVKDQYTTTTGRRYIEVACLLVGNETGVVVVGATTPQDWTRISTLIERAISGSNTT